MLHSWYRLHHPYSLVISYYDDAVLNGYEAPCVAEILEFFQGKMVQNFDKKKLRRDKQIFFDVGTEYRIIYEINLLFGKLVDLQLNGK